MRKASMAKIAIFGGMHGLKFLTSLFLGSASSISLGVTPADSGGKTRLSALGRHRVPSGGDVTNMIGLTSGNAKAAAWLKASCVHGCGSLRHEEFADLVAKLGDVQAAVDELARKYGSQARILPTSLTSSKLIVKLANGAIYWDEATVDSGIAEWNKIVEIDLSGARLNTEVPPIIANADMNLFGLGSQATSVIPSIAQPDIQHALKTTNASNILVVNPTIMSGDVIGFDVPEVVEAMQRFARIDAVLYNITPVPERLLRSAPRESRPLIAPRGLQSIGDIPAYGCELLDLTADGLTYHPGVTREAIINILESSVLQRAA